MKGLLLIGIMGLILALGAPTAAAGFLVTVTDLQTGSTHAAFLINTTATTSALCMDMDDGYKPNVLGYIEFARPTNPNDFRHLTETNNQGVGKEFACGNQIAINGIVDPNIAAAFYI